MLRQQWERVIVLANRAPFRHERSADGGITVRRSASGLVTALEPLVEACSGTWVAHGAGNADSVVVDGRGGLSVPPANPQYRLRYVSLGEEEYRGYYCGFANEGLWPLCHAVRVQPVFRRSDYQMYRAANTRFAAAVTDEAGCGAPLVLVQDYHFALAPRLVRDRVPSSTVVAFWHIPWPRPRMFATCPWAPALLDGLLGSSIVGLQTAEDCANFLGSVEALLDARVDRLQGIVRYHGQTTMVRAYPVGIEWTDDVVSAAPPVEACREQVCRDLSLPAGVKLAVGIDRLDYTKGINEKFLTVEHLLERQPELRERLVLVQVAEPSRGELPAYRAARAHLHGTAERVNRRFGSGAYRPIHLLERHHEPAEVCRLYRAADVCYVGSLHDGMNLVAKEFVRARNDGCGVLVLSQLAGAAQQLRAALLIDPYAIEGTATTLGRALAMSAGEQRRRMRLLRANVEEFDAYWWARQQLEDARPATRNRRLPFMPTASAQPALIPDEISSRPQQ
jgi:trehalose 6-phosphate synthase